MNNYTKNKCQARCKNNLLKQCTININNKDCIFCKKHQNTDINSKYNINNPLYSINEINNFILDFKNIKKLKKKNIILMKYILYKYNFINNTTNYTNINIIDLFNNFLYYNNNIKYIIFIQSIIRKNFILYINKLKGPGLLNKNISVNDTDFYTFQSIYKIKYNYFFSYKENSHIYCFDIRSFELLLEKFKSNNPYTRNSINNNIKNNSYKLIKYLKKHNLFKNFNDDILTPEQENTQQIIKIFQKIDSFGYNTNILWFSELSIINLNKLWSYLEDIWNYRANLSFKEKNNIINSSIKPFLMYYKYKNTFLDKKILQNYILDDFNIFISSGINKDFSNIGCLYILTALSMVSNNCLNSMPWLNQIFI